MMPKHLVLFFEWMLIKIDFDTFLGGIFDIVNVHDKMKLKGIFNLHDASYTFDFTRP